VFNLLITQGDAVRQLLRTAIFTLLFISSVIAAATQDGIPPFSAADVHELDTIKLMSLTPVLNFGIQSKRGAFPFSYTLTSSQQCNEYRRKQRLSKLD
jgi:hypothetical protein